MHIFAQLCKMTAPAIVWQVFGMDANDGTLLEMLLVDLFSVHFKGGTDL